MLCIRYNDYLSCYLVLRKPAKPHILHIYDSLESRIFLNIDINCRNVVTASVALSLLYLGYLVSIKLPGLRYRAIEIPPVASLICCKIIYFRI